MTATSSSSLTQRARCMTTSPSTGSISGRWFRNDSMRQSGAWSMPRRPPVSLRSLSSGFRTEVTNPSVNSRCSMMGMVWTLDSHGMPKRALSCSPPEQSRIGSSPLASSTPFSAVVLPVMSWALRLVR